jgi:hypothetical protein
MLAAVLFYSILFLVMVILPALFILAVLLCVEYGRRFWKRFGGAIVPVANGLWDRPSAHRLRNRFPRTLAFLGRRVNPHDAWGLPATLASLAILAGLGSRNLGSDLRFSAARSRTEGLTLMVRQPSRTGFP